MNLSEGRPRYRGVRQLHAARGMLVAGYLSAMLWLGFGYAIRQIF